MATSKNNKSDVKSGMSTLSQTWYVIDVNEKVLGRSSSKVAFVLQGKHNPAYVGNKNMGDHVIVLNASKIKLTGDKLTQRFHYHHSRYPGGIRKQSAQVVHEKDPRKLLIQSVYGMLPRNSMRKLMMKRLHVYADATHPHQNISPLKLEADTVTPKVKKAKPAKKLTKSKK